MRKNIVNSFSDVANCILKVRTFRHIPQCLRKNAYRIRRGFYDSKNPLPIKTGIAAEQISDKNLL